MTTKTRKTKYMYVQLCRSDHSPPIHTGAQSGSHYELQSELLAEDEEKSIHNS